MTSLPHDIQDLYLAPVALAIDARIAELSKLEGKDLALAVALESDCADWNRELRDEALLRAVTHLADLHGWTANWDERGIRLTHGPHTFVLGVSAGIEAYRAGTDS
jgi:hypothetical protein